MGASGCQGHLNRQGFQLGQTAIADQDGSQPHRTTITEPHSIYEALVEKSRSHASSLSNLASFSLEQQQQGLARKRASKRLLHPDRPAALHRRPVIRPKPQKAIDLRASKGHAKAQQLPPLDLGQTSSRR